MCPTACQVVTPRASSGKHTLQTWGHSLFLPWISTLRYLRWDVISFTNATTSIFTPLCRESYAMLQCRWGLQIVHKSHHSCHYWAHFTQTRTHSCLVDYAVIHQTRVPGFKALHRSPLSLCQGWSSTLIHPWEVWWIVPFLCHHRVPGANPQ